MLRLGLHQLEALHVDGGRGVGDVDAVLCRVVAAQLDGICGQGQAAVLGGSQPGLCGWYGLGL